MTKYAIDHQEAATVLKGTAMPVVSVIVNNKILKATFEFQTKIRIKGSRFFLVYKLPNAQLIVERVHKIIPNGNQESVNHLSAHKK
jgi:hypothetical protein